MKLAHARRFDLIVAALVLFAYGLNRFWLKTLVIAPGFSYLLKCHFNDWLAGISLIAYFNLVLSVSQYRHIKIKSSLDAVLICLACGILWEYILPGIFSYGTSDMWDMVAYTLGGISYVALFRADQYLRKKRECKKCN